MIGNLGTVTAAEIPDGVDQQWWRDKERIEAQESLLTPPPAVIPEETLEPIADYPTNEQPCRVVSSVRLIGEEAAHFQFGLVVLHQGAQTIIGQCLGEQGAMLAAKHVQQVLVLKGYITTSVVVDALSPEGALTLRILPGRLGDVLFEDGKDRSSEVRFALSLRSGELLNLRALEQALETWSRLPNTEVSFKVIPTERRGYSDILVTWRQGNPWRLIGSADNAGSATTGRYQGSLSAVWGNALHLNDLASISVTRSLGGATGEGNPYLFSLTGQWSIPFGYWRMEASWMRSEAVQWLTLPNAPRYITQNQSGQMAIYRTLHRDAQQHTEGFGQLLLHRGSGDLGGVLAIQNRRATQWEVGMTHRRYRGTATLHGTLAYRRGSFALNALPAPESDQACCLPKMIRWEAGGTLPFRWHTQALMYRTSLRGQWNHGRLSAQDRFALGSRYTVRGYDDTFLVAGDDGMLWRQEGAVSIGGQQIYLAYDMGWVRGSIDPQRLSGGGIGTRGQIAKGVAYDVFAGWGREVSGCQAGTPVMNASISWQW